MSGNLKQNTTLVLSDKILDSSIKTFIIVIKDNEASEYYYNYVKDSWTDYGFDLERFDAVTPEILQYQPDLKFGFHQSKKYKQTIDIQKEFAPTEKAVWHSHYSLWKKCVSLNQPILVLEHDTLLMNRDNMLVRNTYDFITYDNSFGCYYITPRFAKILVHCAEMNIIEFGPYGFVSGVNRGLGGRVKVVESIHLEFQKCVIQVMSKKYGVTNHRYSEEDDKNISTWMRSDPALIEKFKNNYKFLMIP